MRSVLAGLRTLVLPWGASSSGPRIVLGPDIPTVLTTWAAANNVTIVGAIVKYRNGTDFEWDAVGTFAGFAATFSGTYDTINGVYVVQRIISTGANDVETRIGSYAINAFAMLWLTQNTTVSIGDGSKINDLLVANCDVQVLGNVLAKTGPNTVETWHAAALANGFTNRNATNFAGLSYRLLASPPNTVQIIGEIVSGATVASGTDIATLPAGYRPLRSIPILAQNLSTATPLDLECIATGELQLHGTWANGAVIILSGLIPLDL